MVESHFGMCNDTIRFCCLLEAELNGNLRQGLFFLGWFMLQKPQAKNAPMDLLAMCLAFMFQFLQGFFQDFVGPGSVELA